MVVSALSAMTSSPCTKSMRMSRLTSADAFASAMDLSYAARSLSMRSSTLTPSSLTHASSSRSVAREVAHQTEKARLTAARAPVLGLELGSDVRIIDDVPLSVEEVFARLVHGHLREHVAVVVRRRFIRQDVRDAHERSAGETALDLFLDLVRDAQDVFLGQLVLRKLVERLFKVRHGDHRAKRHHLVRVLFANVAFD